jgi:hypothetical protein
VIRLPEKGPWPIAVVVVIIGVAALVVGRDYVFRFHWSSGGMELAPAQISRTEPTVKPQ